MAGYALAVAAAAHRLNELRERWLNPPERTERVPEVVPGYPDRLLAQSGHGADLKQAHPIDRGRPAGYRGVLGNVLGSKAMRSEELAVLAGDIRPVDLGAVHNRARDEVVSKGKATGKEHGVAVFADGSTVSFGGKFQNSLEVPEFDSSDGPVTVHHNHPTGDSLSRPDLHLLLGRTDLARVDAHGHLGGWSSAERIGDALPPHVAEILVQDASSQARMLTMRAANRGYVSPELAQAGLWQAVMALLLERQGAIRYALNSESVLAMARKVINER